MHRRLRSPYLGIHLSIPIIISRTRAQSHPIMDGLSLAANVIAVLTAAMQTSKFLFEFFQGMADAPAEIRQNVVWLQALYSTFNNLHHLMNDPRFSDFNAIVPADFKARLTSCQADLQKIERRISRTQKDLHGNRMLQTWTKVKYTLSGDQRITKFSSRLVAYQSAFTIDLVTVHM